MQPRVIARTEHCVSRKNIDKDALKVLYRLYRAGHTVYLVGGGVRDLVLGCQPKDFDIATSARPSQIKRLFRNCRLVGRRFRLAHIQFGQQKILEVSTFRREPDLESGAREADGDNSLDMYVRSDNTFGTPEEDAMRRDFTINSLFYDIGSYSLIDYVGGAEDLQRGIIRTIGDPNLRFEEDPVRMIRAIKFCARLGFKMDRATWEGIVAHSQAIANASAPRVQEEIIRLLESHSAKRCLELLDDSGLLEIMVPELFQYLERADAGNLPYDSDGQLCFKLMNEADQCKYSPSRPLLYSAIMLPQVLEAGLLDKECQEDNYRAVVKTLAARYGISRRSIERCLLLYATMRRMVVKTGRPLSRNFFTRNVFPESLALLKMMCGAGILDMAEYDEWKRRADESIGRKLRTSSAASADSAVAARSPEGIEPQSVSKGNGSVAAEQRNGEPGPRRRKRFTRKASPRANAASSRDGAVYAS